jgi:hypothetical protein
MVSIESQDGRVSKTSVVGNEFCAGPVSRDTRPIIVHQQQVFAAARKSRVCQRQPAPDSAAPTELVTLSGGDVIPNLMTQTTAPVEPGSLRARRRTARYTTAC